MRALTSTLSSLIFVAEGRFVSVTDFLNSTEDDYRAEKFNLKLEVGSFIPIIRAGVDYIIELCRLMVEQK